MSRLRCSCSTRAGAGPGSQSGKRLSVELLKTESELEVGAADRQRPPETLLDRPQTPGHGLAGDADRLAGPGQAAAGDKVGAHGPAHRHLQSRPGLAVSQPPAAQAVSRLA